MITNKKVEKYLWISTVLFISYILLGSFVVSKNLVQLLYLILFYAILLAAKLLSK